MSRYHWLGFTTIGSLCVVALLGCNQRPAVPTVAPQPTEPVVVVVITATSQPTLAPTNTVEPTITPLATFTPVTFETATPTVQATVVAQATRPPVTAAAPQPTAQVQPTEVVTPTVAAPTNFAAPAAAGPVDKAFRNGDSINFEFSSVGPLAPDQCYRIDVTLGHPTDPGGVGDYWVGLCNDQSAAGQPLTFLVNKGTIRDAPNYGSLLSDADVIIPPTSNYVMKWFVTAVRIVDPSDPVHPKVEPVSPASVTLQNTFEH